VLYAVLLNVPSLLLMNSCGLFCTKASVDCTLSLWPYCVVHTCSEIKERIKKTKDEKKAKKAEVAKSQKTQTKCGAALKGAKGPKIGGGGGKR
jgi:hypothetical protein